jgi:hypothetical protein
MKPNTKQSIEHEVLETVRSDCQRWRRLVSQCAQTDDFVSPSTEEQYRVVHGRILATCRQLVDEKSVPVSRRHIALELDELLRPWSSPSALKEAPPKIVSDLVKYQTILDEQLRGRRRNLVGRRLRQLVLTACLAAVGGISIVFFLQSTSSNPSTPLTRFLQGLLTNIAAYLGQATFTEQFAIAVMFSWLFGTWLLSKLSRS